MYDTVRGLEVGDIQLHPATLPTQMSDTARNGVSTHDIVNDELNDYYTYLKLQAHMHRGGPEVK